MKIKNNEQKGFLDNIYHVIIFFCFLFAVLALIGIGTDAKAAGIKGIKLKNFTTIKKYDLDGDGKKDELYIGCKKRDQYLEGQGEDWYISVNGKIKYQQKVKYTAEVDVVLYPVSSKRVYLDITESIPDESFENMHGFYQYKNQALKLVCDFWLPKTKHIYNFRFDVVVKKVTAKTLVISCFDELGGVAGITWEMSYGYKNGKWKLNGNTYKAVTYTKQYTATRKIVTTKKAGKKTKSFVVKKGDRVKVKKICIKKSQVFIQVQNAKGKTGWFLSPKKDVSFFKEAMFAG